MACACRSAAPAARLSARQAPRRAAAASPRAPGRRLHTTRAEGQAAAPAKKWPEEVAPKGVALPPVKPTRKPATFGFVDNAETINSRAAMIGFFGVIIVEFLAGKGLLEMAGVETGNGIDIGF